MTRSDNIVGRCGAKRKVNARRQTRTSEVTGVPILVVEWKLSRVFNPLFEYKQFLIDSSISMSFAGDVAVYN